LDEPINRATQVCTPLSANVSEYGHVWRTGSYKAIRLLSAGMKKNGSLCFFEGYIHYIFVGDWMDTLGIVSFSQAHPTFGKQF